MFSRRRLSVAAMAVIGLVLVPGVAVAGSVSSGPLTLTVKDAPFFVKGTQAGILDYCGTGGDQPLWESALLQQGMSATSPYGIASWDVAHSYSFDSPGPWTHYAQTTPPLIRYTMDNYDSSNCGGGISDGQGVIVRVTDKHGNVAELEEMQSFFFERWDNTNVDDGFYGTWTYSSGWAVNSGCGQCVAGTTAYTTRKSASATFTLSNAWSSPPYGPRGTAAHLGLVMTEGPGRGAVKLYVDGALKATIDTKAASYKYRTYIYDAGPLAPGAHTIKIVNVGTSGRPRIDLQGMGMVFGSTDVPYCDPDTC